MMNKYNITKNQWFDNVSIKILVVLCNMTAFYGTIIFVVLY